MCHQCHVTVLALASAAIAAAAAHDPAADTYERDYDPHEFSPQSIYDFGRLLALLHPNEQGELQDPEPLAAAILALGSDRMADVAAAAHHLAFASRQVNELLSRVLVGLAMNGDERATERLHGSGAQVIILAAAEAAAQREHKTDAEVVEDLLASLRKS